MFRFAGEPTLTELLSEPIIQAMMHSDSVAPGDVCRLLRGARQGRLPAPNLEPNA